MSKDEFAHWPNAVTDLKRCISRKMLPVGVAHVARLQVAPQELPNSGESGYPKIRHGVAPIRKRTLATRPPLLTWLGIAKQ